MDILKKYGAIFSITAGTILAGIGTGRAIAYPMTPDVWIFIVGGIVLLTLGILDFEIMQNLKGLFEDRKMVPVMGKNGPAAENTGSESECDIPEFDIDFDEYIKQVQQDSADTGEEPIPCDDDLALYVEHVETSIRNMDKEMLDTLEQVDEYLETINDMRANTRENIKKAKENLRNSLKFDSMNKDRGFEHKVAEAMQNIWKTLNDGFSEQDEHVDTISNLSDNADACLHEELREVYEEHEGHEGTAHPELMEDDTVYTILSNMAKGNEDGNHDNAESEDDDPMPVL